LVSLCALFAASAADSVVVFNEINYNPAPGQAEFIELRNLHGVDVNMAGWTITGGIDFTFPAGTIIPGHGHMLIGAVPGAVGAFSGVLNNAGDTLRLRNLNGRIMDEVSYDDEGDWPVGADGSGATLSRRGASADPGPEAWMASRQIGGTPGAENFSLFLPIDRTLLSRGSTWKYRDDAAAPPSNWMATGFDDAAWSQGNAPFGTPGAPPTLTVTNDLVERFRASAIAGVADGGVVTSWLDEATGDGLSQNAAAGTTTPTLRLNVTPSGKPAVRFDGNDELRTTVLPGIGATSGFTYFVVVKANATPISGGLSDGSGAYVFDRHLSGAGNPLVSLKAVSGKYGWQKRYDAGTGLGGPLSATSISTTDFQIVALRRNRAQNRFELWVNGVMESTEGDTGGALTPDPINIGRHATGTTAGLNGDIAELLIYRNELNDFDFQAVGSYLEAEYGIDTAFSGNVVATPLSPSAPTSYLRKSFTFPGDPTHTTLRLSHLVADGAVFYLNGTELFRTNLPDGPVAHTTAASSIVTNPSSSAPFVVPAGALLNGTNVLAVSLHKAASSPGVLFDAALDSTETPVDPSTGPQLLFNEIAGANDVAFFVELRNPSAAVTNTSGWRIVASTGESVAIPPQNIPSNGFLTLDVTALGFRPLDGTRLFLLAPGGTELRDAHEVTNRLRGITADGRWGHPTTATPGGTNVAVVSDAIVINEIFYNAVNDGPEQWVELHNRSAAAVDVSFWKFSDGVTYQFPAGTPPIAPGGFVVVAWDPAAFGALHPGVTAFGPFGGSLSGKGELLRLRDANDNVVDEVTFADSGRWSEWADGGGSSLELRDPDADNAQPEAWDASDESGASTWQTVSYSGPATNPAGGDPTTWNEFVMGLLAGGEYLIDDISVKNVTLGNVELIQNGTFDGGTAAAWRIIGNHRGAVVDDPTAPGNKVLQVFASGPTEHMHNHAETTLKNGTAYHTISASQTYTISFRAKWLRGSNRLHTRLYLNRLARQTLLNRPTTGGTPGAVNGRRVANAGPTFAALAHAPVVPAAGQSATVSIRVADPDGVANVQLFTSVNGAAFTSVPMTESDGVFSAMVAGQSAGAVVQFYLRATDNLGAISFFPAAGPASRALIPWRDGKAILQFPSGARAHNVRIVLPPGDATELYKQENLMSNGQIPCTVILDEREVYYHAAVRLRASEHARFNPSRVGFILGFGGDQLFMGAHSAVTLDRSGGLGGGQGEILIKAVSNAAGGIHAPEDDIARVIAPVGSAPPATYNGIALTGPAILSKTRFDDTYLDNQFPNGGDGPVFKYERVYVLTQTINPTTRVIDSVIVPENPKIPQDTTAPPGVAVTSLGANKENYRWYWLLENAREADDYSGLINVVTAIGQSGGSAAFNTQTAQTIDINTWLRTTVPSALFGVTDNYLGTGGGQHNALIYIPPGGKAVLIPWDLDFLNQSNPSASLTAGGDLGKFLVNPVHKRTFYGHLLDVLNRSFNNTFLTRWAQHYSRFGTDDMTASLSYLNARAQYARNVINGTGGQVAPIPSVPFRITTPSPLTVNTPFATIAGDGWIDVAAIHLLGSPQPLAVTWTDDNSFSLQLPVSAGTNTYTLVAYNPTGVEVGRASIVVEGTGGVFPAAAGTLVVSELNYNPPGSTDATEFIELLNITGATLDLTGAHFDEEIGQGISYTFGAVQIPAGGRILIVRDRTAFAAAYPSASPLAPGQFTGALDNDGETIVLYAASGMEILKFTYTDELADGDGASLVRVLSSTNPDPNNYSWRASAVAGGNPGTTDAVPFAGAPLADNDGDRRPAFFEYALGTSDLVADLPSPGTLSRDLGGRVTFTLTHALAADDVALVIEAASAAEGPWSAASVVRVSSQINGANTTETWEITPFSGSGSLFIRLRATLR
jgi:hypothetical protein